MIQISNLTKRYPNDKGIFHIDFTVEEGEVFGFLGPNGAGKTTTIRHLLGFLRPDEGRCAIGGLDCFTHAAEIQKSLGYVPGEMAFFDRLTGLELMHMMADMRGMKDVRRRDELIARFELDAHVRLAKMSKGMKQKVGLVIAFMHDPAVYILDEPTSGLDPLMQRRFIELVHEEQGRGKTILLSSHMFAEIDRTCQRAAMIRAGKIVDVEDLAAMKQSLQQRLVVAVAEADVERLAGSGLTIERLAPTRVAIDVQKGQYNTVFHTLAACNVTGLEVEEQTLEQIFLGYYGEA
jgi:ABC-2 type transport system ATP-binding protein